MNALWTLKSGSDERSFADWGIEQPQLRRLSQQASVLSFRVPQDMDAAALFTFESTLQVFKQPDPDNPATRFKWFEGAVMEPERSGSDGEWLQYEVHDPFYWLDNRVFQQEWQSYDNSLGQLVTLRKSRLFLGLNYSLQKLDTKQQLIEALDWAVNNGAPIAYDASTFPAVQFPVAQANQVTVGEVIRMMLQVTPDAVTWFDYSTTPYATLHIARAADLTPVSLGITESEAQSLQIKTRRDLQRPAVYINYEINSTVNGQQQLSTHIDKHPSTATGTEHKAAIFTIDLQGAQITSQSVDLVVEPINADHPNGSLRNDWWRKKVQWLDDPDIDSFTVVNVVKPTSRPNEPVEGQVAPWFRDNQANFIQSGEEVITGLVRFTYTDGRKGEKPVQVRITSTNAVSQTYSTLTAYTTGEPIPVGLAQAHYIALNKLHYQGRLIREQHDVDGLATIGNCLNLTGGSSEWASMDAIIWEVTEDLETGRTQIAFGPAENLAPPDLVANMELWRHRFMWHSLAAMSGGGQSNKVDGRQLPTKENTMEGMNKPERVIMEIPDKPFGAPDGAQLDCDLQDAVTLIPVPNARRIKLRVVDECVEVSPGVFETWNRLVLCSDRWQP